MFKIFYQLIVSDPNAKTESFSQETYSQIMFKTDCSVCSGSLNIQIGVMTDIV